MKDTTEQDIEQILAEKFEGGLFAEISLTNIMGNTFLARRDLYTVLNGICYSVCEARLVPTGDSMLNIKTSCHRIGKYDPEKQYQSTVSKDYTYSEIKNIFKL